MRICSLLPSATEIIAVLGLGDQLVGVSHECDHPPEVANLPKLTWSNIPPSLSSGAIDAAVSAALADGGGLYGLDVATLERLAPTHVLTQRLCDVCAVSVDHLETVLATLICKPQVLYLEPHSLEDILRNIGEVAAALGQPERGTAVVAGLRARIERVRAKSQSAARPRVFCMEWIDPPYCGGHWMQELVELAGGEDALAHRHRPSYRVSWNQVLDFAPELIVLTCCGYDLVRCLAEAPLLLRMQNASQLPAIRDGRVFATDGSSYFSRPGPRIVDSLEILAHLIHPERFAPPALPGSWAKVDLQRAAAA
jgi:iron complex transport system substrate-binding protein